jgi:soluble lytic murein transglycosylase-like protein
MQLMPETAQGLGIKDPFDPKANVMGGVRYLKEMLTRFNGSIPLALAAYNAGPARIGPRREIPHIRETRGYVRKVLNYMNRY